MLLFSIYSRSIHRLFTVYSEHLSSLFSYIYVYLENKRIKYIVNVKQKTSYMYYQGGKFIYALYRFSILLFTDRQFFAVSRVLAMVTLGEYVVNRVNRGGEFSAYSPASVIECTYLALGVNKQQIGQTDGR